MGSLRTLLAITVVFAHSPYGSVFIGGQLAVQLFYMISGFLIAHVLRTNPAYADPRRFYVNRLLRIYPVYLVVAISTLLYAATVNQAVLDVYRHIPTSAALLAGISNVTIFGQDWVMFSGVSDGHLRFFTDFTKSDPPLWHALLVPQAWTLGVELTFYAMAPFILRRAAVLWLLLVLSCAIRAGTWSLGLGSADPWNYRFFPSELALFLLGALSNHHGLSVWERVVAAPRLPLVSSMATAYLLLLCIGFQHVPVSHALKVALLLGSCAVCLPLAFIFQYAWRMDKWIGELSYPIYIVHMLVIWSIGSLMPELGLIMGRRTVTALVVVASVVSAIVLNRTVAAPVERLRRRVGTISQTEPPSVPQNIVREVGSKDSR